MAAQLETAEWAEYKLGELFEVKSNPQLDKSSFVFSENGKYPYFTRTSFNNGILGYVEYLDEAHKVDKGCLAVGMIAMEFFYMRNDFYAGQFTKRAIPKNFVLNNRLASFFIAVLNRNQKVLQNELVRNFEDTFNKIVVQLPTKNGKIDFEFMETFTAELEAQRVAELEAHLTVTGQKNYILTPEEESAIEHITNSEFREFNVVDVFTVKNTRSILSRDIELNSGDRPYLCASSENNAVNTYISYDESQIDKGNCIFIGGKTFVVTYQKDDFFSNDSHNLALYFKQQDKLDRLSQLYLVTSVRRGLGHKYTWGDSISTRKIQSDKIMLPVKNGQPDFELMETIISAVQKLVIKDVVQYADEKIAATKDILVRDDKIGTA